MSQETPLEWTTPPDRRFSAYANCRRNWIQRRNSCPNSSASSLHSPPSFFFTSPSVGARSAAMLARASLASLLLCAESFPDAAPRRYSTSSAPTSLHSQLSIKKGPKQHHRGFLKQLLGRQQLQDPGVAAAGSHHQRRRSVAFPRTDPLPEIPAELVRRTHNGYSDIPGRKGKPHLTPGAGACFIGSPVSPLLRLGPRPRPNGGPAPPPWSLASRGSRS